MTLASASPRRLELLQSLGLDVRVVPSTYAEPPYEGFNPKNLAVTHAREKAHEVEKRVEGDTLLVAADTVVDLDGTALGKPCDLAEARRMLHLLSGRDHVVHTAFTLISTGAGRLELSDLQSTRVRFFKLPAEDIESYVATSEPMDKAGAYGIQGIGATLVERIDGDFYTVMGFPIARFARCLPRMGFALHGAKKPAP
ncbi:MAG: septum formation protein Maf [Candidatus Meridianibacter frigidus]|nr:MAG: septum formation protein Maf [Candidatus Eremiobacteraeota bacterium]